MVFEDIAQKVIREMRERGKVVDLSKRESYNLGNAIRFPLEIKQESERRQRLAWADINDVESGRINVYNKDSLYKRIFNYFSNYNSGR